ncbi:unnamed protein product [Urochloa humidicola]
MTLAVAAAAVLVSLAGMLVAGDACNHVPALTADDACLKLNLFNTTERLHELCREMLLIDAPATAEVTVYAMAAARQARLRYMDGLGEMDQMLSTGGKIPADEMAAYLHCRENYEEAARLMAAVADQLFACDFWRVRQEYIHAKVAVRSCLDGLWAYRGSPVFDRVSVDFDLTMVAYLLGAITVGR